MLAKVEVPMEGGVHNGMNYHSEALNKEFVELFDKEFDRNTMREFIYATDLLREITKSRSFPSGKLLNNKDVTPRFILALKRIAEVTGDRSLYGCQVSKETEELIEEFFEYKYPALFSRIFAKLSHPFLVFYVDGAMFQVSFQRQIGCIKDFCNITFNNTLNDTVCHIPFHISRCSE